MMKKYGILLCLAFALGVVIFTKEPPQILRDPIAPLPAETQKSPPFVSEYRSLVPLANAPSREIAELAPLLNAPIAMRASGVPQKFELATDELYLRLPDGSQRVVSIPKATTPAAFAVAIDKARAEHGIEPELVLYPLGAPRNEYSRRIVTRDVVVKAAAKSEADALVASGGLVFQKSLDFAPDAFVYKAPTSLQALTAQLDTESVNLAAVSTQLAKKAAKMSMPNDPYVQLQWHLKNTGQRLREPGGVDITATPGIDINVESVWNYPEPNSASYDRGQGVVIGIVDDGLQWNHPDLQANVIRDLQWDWIQSDNDPSPYYYDDAHGTACAGVAAARGNNRLGVSGVAPEASLVGMRLISEYDHVTDLDQSEAMAWKLNQIDIKSNSWGYNCFSVSQITGLFTGWNEMLPNGELTEASLKYAADFGREGKGSIFTFAAGNQHEFTLTTGAGATPSFARVDFKAYPNSIYTIAVGAVGSNGIKSNYSQVGSCLLISAPSNTTDNAGLGIMTTDVAGDYGYVYSGGHSNGADIRGSGDYSKTFGGTSSACPTISGVIALMLQKNPDLGWRDVQEILIKSAYKIDAADTDWIDNGAGYHFNYKYGAGLVDAAAAVNLASTWNNLAPQKSQTVSTTVPLTIAPGATENATFTVNGDDLRLEHVTLRLTIDNIFKGDLEIKLTSPDGMESIFCELHSDKKYKFTDWTFMTVRNWGESSNGDWTLTITNHGATAGNLTAAELVVYGQGALVDAPVVTLATSKKVVFVGSSVSLTATAKDKNNNPVEKLEAFVSDGTSDVSLGASNGTWTIQANKSGNYTFTVHATDGEGTSGLSNEVQFEVLDMPIAAWDFDTLKQSPEPLATVIQGKKKYAANFGSGNMTFNGDFTIKNEDAEFVISNYWSSINGEIWVSNGTDKNSIGEMHRTSVSNNIISNNALLIRGGKNIGAQNKSIVLEFSMENLINLNVYYATQGDSNGFDVQTWWWSVDGVDWQKIQEITPNSTFSSQSFNSSVSALNNAETAYLRVEFSGTNLAANGTNRIDNLVISASKVTVIPVSEKFTVLSTSYAKGGVIRQEGATSQPGGVSAVEPEVSVESLDWVLEEPGIHEMLVHAEVVDGSQFLNGTGSLLSATEDGMVLGIAEPVSQATRYDLGITSAKSRAEPLLLKLYDAASKRVMVLEERVSFASGVAIGSPSLPKRFNVDYIEVEQVVPVSPGWTTFTTAVDPEPASLAGALADYDFSEGDQLVGAGIEATVIDGKWQPIGGKLKPRSTYSILRQAPNASQIILIGKDLDEFIPKESVEIFEGSSPDSSVENATDNSQLLGNTSAMHSASSNAHESQAASTKSEKSSKKSKASKSKLSKKSKKGKKGKKGKAKRGKKSRAT